MKPGASSVDVAVNETGDAVAGWLRRGDDVVIRAQAAYRPAGAAPQPRC